MTAPLFPQPAPSLGLDRNEQDQGPLGSLAPLLAGLGHELSQRQAQTQQLLVQKGQLALEQEKQQAEEEQIKLQNKERKDKADQLAQAGQSLNAALEKAQSPEDFVAALQGNLGKLMVADPDRAIGIATALGGLKQTIATQQQQQAKQAQAAAIVRANAGLMETPAGRRAVATQLYALDPKFATEFEQAFPAPKTTTVSTSPGEKTTVLDENFKPVFRQEQASRESATANVTANKMKFAVEMALKGLKQAEDVVGKDDKADAVPVGAVAAETIMGNRFFGSKHGGEVAYQKALTPNQKLFDRALTQVAHSISGLFGGQRSIYIYESMLSAYRPNAGQSDAETRQAFRDTRRTLKESLLKMRAGDFSGLAAIPGVTPEDIAGLMLPPNPLTQGKDVQPNSSAAIGGSDNPVNWESIILRSQAQNAQPQQ